MLKETAEHLKEIITARNVMGEGIDMGNRMIIPVTRFGFGFGAGGGGVSENNGVGGGAGGGIEPVAVIITDKELSGIEGIQVISLKNNNPIAQVITALGETLVPQVIDLIKKRSSTGSSSESTPEDTVSS
jgi:uncharacterized spore protein YtfJ